jgi:hypothetical protein
VAQTDPLPYKKDLLVLPLRALAAYAARCARRVQPLYDQGADGPEAVDGAAVIEEAIRFAEAVARGGPATGQNGSDATAFSVQTFGTAVAAAGTAALAAHCADQATCADIFPDAAEKTAEFASEAGIFSSGCFPYLTANGRLVENNPASEDFRRLIELRLGTFPERGEPVDPSEQGPLGLLWPEGAPVWWPGDANDGDRGVE